MPARVLVAATGKDAELVDRVPITRSSEGDRCVVMSLPSGGRSFSALPDLKADDRLTALAELEVTTDWPHAGPGCVAKPYTFAPTVEAQLLLAASPKAVEPGADALAIGKPASQQVTQGRHHHVFVFPNATLKIPSGGLHWPGRRYLNLVVSAHNPGATTGQFLLVGQNQPDGTVEQNQGRLNVVRFRPATPPAATVTKTAHRLARKVPVQKGHRTIVYSLALSNLKEDEQLVISAQLPSSAQGLGYPARISTELVLASDPTESKSGRGMKTLASLRGEITKFNGFNCLPSAGSCLTEKVGVLRILRSTRRDVFVNLVAVSASPTHQEGAGDALQVLPGGYVQAQRYGPKLLG
jgi:hypothetical protein